MQDQFEADQSRARDHLRQTRAEAESAERTAADIRSHTAVLHPAFADAEQMKVVTADGSGEGEEQAVKVLDGFVKKHLQDI